MIRIFVMATVASIAVATSASAGSPQTLPPDRSQLLAAFLESVKPIPATPTEQAAALTRPEEPKKKAEPMEIRPLAVAAAGQLTPASFHRSPSAWLDDYYRALTR